MKKIISLLLAFCLLLTAAVPAFAVTTKTTQPDQTFNFKTKKDFSNWFIENRYTSAFAKEIIENKGYYLSTNPSPDESDEPNDIYRLSSDTFDDINGYYHIFLSPEGIPNLPRITLCLALLPDGVNDLEYAFKTFTPGIYDQYKNAKTVLTEETYNGKEMICWIRESPIPDERPGDFLSCVFIDNGYLVVTTALYTKEDMTWTNEFLDYFELEKVYVGNTFDKEMADVTADRKIDTSDALKVLQYSVGLLEKFPTHYFGNNIDGDVYPGGDVAVTHSESPKDVITKWLNGFKDRTKVLPAMFETYDLNGGGFPVITCKLPDYNGFSLSIYDFNYTAEYGEVEYSFFPPGDSFCKSYNITAIPSDRRSRRTIEEEAKFALPLYSDAERNGKILKKDFDGMETLYWDSDINTFNGCIIRKDGYIMSIYAEEKSTWSESILDIFDFEVISLSQMVQNIPISRKAGDVNRDNKIDSSDALRILQYSVGLVDKVLYEEPAPKPDDPDIDDWDGVTECIITCRVCNRDQWMRPRDGLPGGWIINDDMSYTCPDCK